MDIDAKLDKIDSKLDQVIEVNYKQDITLEKLNVLREVDSVNLETHIKRTDLLQKGQNKLYILIYLAIGGAAVYFGPTVLRFLALL